MTSTSKSIRLASYLMMASAALSSVLGFLRDRVMSQMEGASKLSDVYIQSFLIPDLINHFMASGALSLCFVPLLAGYLARKDQKGAETLYRGISTWMGGVLIVLIIIGEIFAESLALWIAPGFQGEQLALLAELLRIILPAQFFFYVGGLAISIQYAHKKFLFPSLAPIIYNVGIILGGIFFHGQMGVKGFSWGVLIGCFFSHGILQFIGVRRLGYRSGPLFVWTPEFKAAFWRYFYLSLPVMIGFSLVVSDEWLTKYFGSYLSEGSISWLNYARRVMRLPVNFIGQAAGLASFPFLASLWAEQNYLKYGSVVLIEIQKLWAATTLATVFMVLEAEPIVELLFAGGKFGAGDVVKTAFVLRILSLGIFFWSAQMILSRGFYAAQRTWMPSLIGTVVAIVFIPAYQYLGSIRGAEGLAWAGSVGVAVYTILLAWLLLRSLKTHSPELPMKEFIRFNLEWLVVIGIAIGLGLAIQKLHLYRETRLTALLEIGVVLGVFGALGLGTLRGYFKRYTGGEPLF